MHKLLQMPWTAFFGAAAILEGLVMAWGAQRFYQAWSRLYGFVTVWLPWQSKTEEVEVEDNEVEPVSVAPKRARRQPAIDARNE